MVSFFSLPLWIQEKIEARWRNYLILTADVGEECNITDTQNALIIFLSAIAVMQEIFWTFLFEDNFCFISDRRNSFNRKLKKLINEQIIIFCSPSHALCSYDKPVRIKHYFKDNIFIGMCSPFTCFNLQILYSVNKVTSSVKLIEEMCKYVLS